MGRTSLLDASLRLSQARFSSFCFLKFRESNSALGLISALGIWTSSTSRLFPLEIITWDVRCLSLGNGMICPKPSSSSSLVLWLIPAETRCTNDAPSHTWILSFQDVFRVPFLPLSNRIVHTNSKLLRKYWAHLQNEWFGTRAVFEASALKSMVSLLFFFSGFHDSKHWYSWILLWSFQVQCFVLANLFWIFLKILQWRKSWKNIHLNSYT